METYIVDNQKIAKIGGVSNRHHFTYLQPNLLPLSYIIRTATNTGILNNKIGFKYDLGFFLKFFGLIFFFFFKGIWVIGFD